MFRKDLGYFAFTPDLERPEVDKGTQTPLWCRTTYRFCTIHRCESQPRCRDTIEPRAINSRTTISIQREAKATLEILVRVTALSEVANSSNTAQNGHSKPRRVVEVD